MGCPILKGYVFRWKPLNPPVFFGHSSTKTTFGKKTMRKVEENPTFFGGCCLGTFFFCMFVILHSHNDPGNLSQLACISVVHVTKVGVC